MVVSLIMTVQEIRILEEESNTSGPCTELPDVQMPAFLLQACKRNIRPGVIELSRLP